MKKTIELEQYKGKQKFELEILEVYPYFNFYKNGKIIEPSKNNQGYLCIRINKRKNSVHRIISEIFPELLINKKTFEKNELDHIDRDQLNNHYLNLRWVTHKENCSNRRYSKHFSDKDLKFIKENNKMKYREIAKHLNCLEYRVYEVITGRTYKKRYTNTTI